MQFYYNYCLKIEQRGFKLCFSIYSITWFWWFDCFAPGPFIYCSYLPVLKSKNIICGQSRIVIWKNKKMMKRKENEKGWQYQKLYLKKGSINVKKTDKCKKLKTKLIFRSVIFRHCFLHCYPLCYINLFCRLSVWLCLQNIFQLWTKYIQILIACLKGWVQCFSIQIDKTSVFS